MNRTDFSKLGLQYGLDENWTLAALDSLSYAECLNDLLKNLNLKNQIQLNDIMMFGGSSVWETQDALYNSQLPFPSATFLHHNFIRCLPVKTFHRAVINLKLNLPDRFVADVF